jgi:hypothetical protein
MRKGRTDDRLQRRALLRQVQEGQRFRDEVCDAHPELLRAAQHIGTRVADDCPICDRTGLAQVHYVFEGKGPRTRGGRAVPRDALARPAERHGDLTVYTVEVCTDCGWHHLLESYLLLARDTAVG